MPILSKPRRSQKNLSADQYWDIKLQDTKIKQRSSVRHFREQDVKNRNRYIKPSELAKQFKPLLILLNPTKQETSHVQTYLGTIQYHLPICIMNVKKYMFTLPLIIYSLKQIYTILRQNLHSLETWRLMQAVLKDTKNQSYDIFMESLPAIGTFFSSNTFELPFFRCLFDTICIFMQTNYNRITESAESLSKFLYQLNMTFFNHHNKYIRRFSIQSCSYILSNISDQQFEALFPLLVKYELKDQILGRLLICRITIVDGCVTPSGIQRILEQMNRLTKQQKSYLLGIQYLENLLSHLQVSRNQQGLLFDMKDILSSIIKISRNWSIGSLILIRPVLTLLKSHDHKHRVNELKQKLEDIVVGLIIENVNISQQSGLLRQIKQRDLLILLGMYLDNKEILMKSEVIEFCRSASPSSLNLLFDELDLEEVTRQMVEMIILMSKNILTKYVKSQQVSEDQMSVVYQVILLIKQTEINSPINISFFGLTETDLIKKVSFTQKPWEVLVLIRFLSILTLPASKMLVQSCQTMYSTTMSPFNQAIHQNISLYNPQTGIFQWQRHIPYIYAYSHHHDCQWVKLALNIFESYLFLRSKYPLLGERQIVMQGWQNYLMDRVSLVKLMDINTVTNLLQSRHRKVRKQALQVLNETHKSDILIVLSEIDTDAIDLQNERVVKMKLQKLCLLVSKGGLKKQVQIIVANWCLGFAYTGFKLVDKYFISFLTVFIQNYGDQDETNNILMNYLQYYTFQHSRVFNVKFPHIEIGRSPNNLQKFQEQDFKVSDLQTEQWIGINRISESIYHSQKAKKQLGIRLTNLLQSYFTQQFPRNINNMNQLLKSRVQFSTLQQIQSAKKSLLIPDVRYLQIMFRLCPKSYKPPIQCLHMSLEYLNVASVTGLKTKTWDLLWVKDRKIKEEHDDFEVNQISQEEQNLYLHFLWRQIIKGNTTKRRIIIEYIRQKMSHQMNNLLDIFINQMMGIMKFDLDTIVYLLQIVNIKSVLNHIYIMQSIMKYACNYLTNEFIHCSIKFLQAILIFITRQNIPQRQSQHNQNLIQEEQDQEDHIQSNQQQENFGVPGSKQLRKQLFKVFGVAYTYYHRSIPEVYTHDILEILIKHQKIQMMAISAKNSMPGVLNCLQKISCSKHKQLLIQKVIIQSLGKMWTQGVKQVALKSSSRIIMSLLDINQEQSEMKEQMQNKDLQNKIRPFCGILSQSLRFYLTKQKRNSDTLRILEKIFSICDNQISINGWEDTLWKHLSSLALAQRNLKLRDKEHLEILLKISINFSSKWYNQTFITNIITLLPYIGNVQTRQKINIIVSNSYKLLNFRLQIVEIAQLLNKVTKRGLQITIDFQSFFNGLRQYESIANQLSILEHQFIMYNLLSYSKCEELSVRKSITNGLVIFLQKVNDVLSIRKIYNIVLEVLRKAASQNQDVFWNSLTNLGHFVRKFKMLPQFNGFLFTPISRDVDSDNDFFYLICSLSQSNKLKGLKMLKQMLTARQNQKIQQARYPNPVTSIIIPILQHFIIPPQSQTRGVQGNLTSSLSHMSLQIYALSMKIVGQSIQKKELKRIISKIKFQDTHSKKNIMYVRIIGEVIQSVNLQNIAKDIKNKITSEGLEEFHNKLVDQRKKDEDQDQPIQVQSVNNSQYEYEIQMEEAVNKNFIQFQRNLMEKDEGEETNSMVRFLKHHILAPLKSMLFFQSRSKQDKKDEEDKGRMLVSVAVTKILVKFPISVFLFEFQKVLSKLCRLLKKKEQGVRESSRKCLSEISKIVGPQLLYSILREMKFHLRDNLEGHIFNYTTWYVCTNMGQIANGGLDYCLPLILPVIIDQIFGRSSEEKTMVEEGKMPTLLMESKKRKGYELITFLASHLSPYKIQYIIGYLANTLRSYLNTQANITRYQQLVSCIISGLSKNQVFLQEIYCGLYLRILSKSILQNQCQIRKFSLCKGNAHETTVKDTSKKIKKTGYKQVFLLQEQTARNGSIFRNISEQVAEKRNGQIITSCIIQFYMAMATMLLKKKIFNPESVRTGQSQFNIIVNFMFECMDHRDNAITTKSMRIMHALMTWKLPSIQKLNKKVARKILQLMDNLTSADNQLLKQCFGILNDIFSQIDITQPIAQQLYMFLQTHITGESISVGLGEPYKLLKLLIYKQAPIDMVSLYQYIRVQLLNTYDKQLRGLAQSICSAYLRNYIVQAQRKNQLMFYLSNLDCQISEAQLSVLQLIEDFIRTSNTEEVERVGEVVLMGLATAYANGNIYHTQIEKICTVVFRAIDNSKTVSLIKKCILWIDCKNDNLIRLCGYYLINVVIKGKILKINNDIRKSLHTQITSLINEQANAVWELQNEINQQKIQSQALKDQLQWKKIIINDNPSDTKFTIHRCLPIVSTLIIQLKQSNQIELFNDNNFICKLWVLLMSPSKQLFQMAIRLLAQAPHPIVSIGEAILLNKDNSSVMPSVKTILKKAIINSNSCIQVLHLLSPQMNSEFAKEMLRIIINLISGSMTNPLKNKDKIESILLSLQFLLTYKKEIKQSVLIDIEDLKGLMWQIAKISRSSLITEQIKSINERISEIMRDTVGSIEYYRLLGQLQQQRKSNKNKNKADMAQLAITNQQMYSQMKIKKKNIVK